MVLHVCFLSVQYYDCHCNTTVEQLNVWGNISSVFLLRHTASTFGRLMIFNDIINNNIILHCLCSAVSMSVKWGPSLMEFQLKWGERNLGGGGWIVQLYPSNPPMANPYPLTSLPWQLTPRFSCGDQRDKYVCTHDHDHCGNGLCAILMNLKTLFFHILFPPSHHFVTVCSLSHFPSFLPPLFPSHCFLCCTLFCFTLWCRLSLTCRVDW